MDNTIIAQSSQLYDQLLNTIDENTRQLEALNKELIRMQTANLRMPLQYEGCKKENKELKEANYKKDNVIGILAHFAHEHLEMFESIFNSDEGSFQYEDMQKYIAIAEYMLERYGRQTEYIRRVTDRMNELKF